LKAKVFISFCWDDFHYLETLRQHLDLSSVLLSTVITREHTPAKLLAKKVEDGINEATYFVPILTSNSIKNQWVNQEIGYAYAKGKTIYPIVEQEIMGNLKGFVHKQIDLFTFQCSEPDNGNSFDGVAQAVKECIEKNFCVSKDFIKNIVFEGTWKNTYKDLIKGTIDEETFIIKNGHEYHILSDGKTEHVFNLCDLDIDINKKQIMFTKKAIRENDTRAVHNILRYENRLGIKYFGIEWDESVEIEYTNVS
jgi:hypothetical protein